MFFSHNKKLNGCYIEIYSAISVAKNPLTHILILELTVSKSKTAFVQGNNSYDWRVRQQFVATY